MLSSDPIKTSNPFGALNGRSSTTSPSAKASTPTHSVSGNNDAKKKKKKKKKPSTGTVNNTNTEENQELNHETAQLPLARRLEIAASHTDIHAALVGLMGWSRLMIHTDTILEFLQSDALRLLVINILTVRPKQEIVYENLMTLLANCLAVVHDDKSVPSNRRVAEAVVEALRAIMTKLPAHNDTQESKGVDAIVEQTAAYLSKSVVKHRMTLSGITHDSALSSEVFKIEAQLKAAAMKDSEVKGQTIRDSFQRRDIRSDAMMLYQSRLEKVMQLLQEHSAQEDTGMAAPIGGFLAFVEDSCEGQQANDNEVEEVKGQFVKLDEEKNSNICDVMDKVKTREAKLLSLQQEREELEAKLRVVNDKIQGVLSEQEQLKAETKAIEDAFSMARSQLEVQHKQVLHACQQKECRLQVHDQFTKLEAAVMTISKVHSDSQSLLDKHIVCLRQQLEGALRFFASELPCVKFMVNRIEETHAEVERLTQEASSYESLGVAAVCKEMTEKVESMCSHLEEDIQCVATLRKRDLEIVAMMKRIFLDEMHQKASEQLDANLKKEAHRHIEYVQKVHTDAEAAIRACSSPKLEPSAQQKA